MTTATRDRPETPETAAPFICVGTYLPLRNWWVVIPFLIRTFFIQRQLGKTPGLVAHATRADVRGNRYWTYSIWRDRQQLQAFLHSGAHAVAIRQFDGWRRSGAAFTEWECDDPRLSWDEVFAQLHNPTQRWD